MSDVAQSVDEPRLETAISRAVNLLVMAGMTLHYRSIGGGSYYLGWEGRTGVLRVSNHTEVGTRKNVCSRLTLHDGSIPASDHRFRGMVAEALGRYLMVAPLC